MLSRNTQSIYKLILGLKQESLFLLKLIWSIFLRLGLIFVKNLAKF